MTINSHTDKYLRTHDLALAAVLSLSFPIEAVEWIDERRAEFVFTDTDTLQQILHAYWRREYQVEPQAFFHQLKTLKSRLYER